MTLHPLAALPWTYWTALPLLAAVAVAIVGTAVAYLAKGVGPRYRGPGGHPLLPA